MADGEATRDASVRLSAEIDPYSKQLKVASEDTNKLAESVDKLSAKLDGLTKRAGKKLMLFGGAGLAGATGLVAQTAAYEKQLSTLQATAAITDRKMADFDKTINKMAKSFPVSRTEAVQLVTTLDKLGVTGKRNLGIVAESSIRLSQATGESLGGVASSLVQLQRQTDTLRTETMDRLASSTVKVSKELGVAAGGVLNFASAIAPAARTAGMAESTIVGVSAAFTKAGADGFAAATTFNGMINDITRNIVNGSPDIAKYSNLIGVTAEQFKRMDKGEAITQIFETLDKQGPNAIRTLDRLGYDGVRAMRSIQAVTQSGGLRQAIEQATLGYQTDQLGPSSDAAMDGLVDELERSKNMMQQVATESGEPLLAFFRELAQEANIVGEALVPVASLLGQVTGVVGMAGGMAGMALGGAMALAGAKTVVAGAGTLIKGGPTQGALSGFAAGRAAANGVPLAPGSRAGDAMARLAAGQMRWWERMAFVPAMGFGQALGAGTGPGFMERRVGPLLTAPMRLGRTFMDAQTEFYRNSARDHLGRSAPVLGTMGNLGSAALHPLAFLRGMRSGTPADVLSAAGAARDPEDFGKRLRELSKATVAQTAAAGAGMSVQKQVATQAGALAASFVRLEMAGLKAAGSLAMQGGMAVGRGVGGALMGLAGGPVGLALTAGIGGAMFLHANRNQGDVEIGGSAPIDKYNAALGIATSELGLFAQAVSSATSSLPAKAGDPVESVARVSDAVVGLARTPKRKMINDIFENLTSGGARTAMMQLMGITDPRQLELIQADLIQATGSRAVAQRSTDRFFDRSEKGLGVNYEALVRDIRGEQGQGFKGFLGYADPTGAKITGAVFESLLGQYGESTKRFGGTFADQQMVNEAGKFIAAATPNEGGINQKDTNTLFQAVRGFENAFLGKRRLGFNATEFAEKTQGMSEAEQAEFFFTDVVGKNDNKEIREIFKNLGGRGKRRIDFGGVTMDQLDDLRFVDQSSFRKQVLGAGEIGGIGLMNPVVNKAVAEPGNTNAQFDAMNELMGKAKELGGSFTGTDAELQKLKAAIGDTSDRLYILANAAQQLNAARRADAMGFMTRPERLTESVARFRAAQVRQPGVNDQEFQERVSAARDEAVAARKSYADYLASLIQAHKNFAIQMERGEEDLNLTIARSNADFERSMLRAEEDYYRSRSRAQEDFARSVKQSTADFHRSQERAAEDAAKSIYDPFRRIQLEVTASIGTTMENLKTQNDRMDRQLGNVRALKKMGLSQEAVDTLQLGDASNAQQVDRLMEDATQDPDALARINKQVARRQKLAKEMTQSPEMSEGFRRAEEDFNRAQKRATDAHGRAMDRMAEDFATMTDRAAADHARGIDRMVSDYDTQIKRAHEDLARLGEEVFDSFGDMMENAIELVTQNLGKAGDKVIEELKKVREELPELFGDMFGNPADPRQGSSHASARSAEGARADGSRQRERGNRSARVGEGGAKPRTFEDDILDRYIPHATGGIALRPHLGLVAEAGVPEAMIPLNDQGAAFMASLFGQVAKAAVKDMMTIPSVAIRGGTTTVDASTNFTGPVTVKASDPKKMARELEKEARHKRLTRPSR